jgi:hypothetical protein
MFSQFILLYLMRVLAIFVSPSSKYLQFLAGGSFKQEHEQMGTENIYLKT